MFNARASSSLRLSQDEEQGRDEREKKEKTKTDREKQRENNNNNNNVRRKGEQMARLPARSQTRPGEHPFRKPHLPVCAFDGEEMGEDGGGLLVGQHEREMRKVCLSCMTECSSRVCLAGAARVCRLDRPNRWITAGLRTRGSTPASADVFLFKAPRDKACTFRAGDSVIHPRTSHEGDFRIRGLSTYLLITRCLFFLLLGLVLADLNYSHTISYKNDTKFR